MTKNNQEFTDNSYRVFCGLQRPSDQDHRHSRYTVPPARHYATIPWWTFRTPVYEDVHVFMGKRTADKATGFSPDPETEDKATMTGSDEEDEDDDPSKRRRNILEEDLNITFEVELDSDDDEDDFRPKMSSTDPTLRVDFKIIRKHSSLSANNTDMGPDENEDEVMSDEIFEEHDNTPVSLADVLAGILDSEQENRLYNALIGGDIVDNKVIHDHDGTSDVILETSNATTLISLGELNADHLKSEQESTTITIGNTDETTAFITVKERVDTLDKEIDDKIEAINTPMCPGEANAYHMSSVQEPVSHTEPINSSTADYKVGLLKEYVESLTDIDGYLALDKHKYGEIVNEVLCPKDIKTPTCMFIGETHAGHLASEQENTMYNELVDGTTGYNKVVTLKGNVVDTGDKLCTGKHTNKEMPFEKAPTASTDDQDEINDKEMPKDESMCCLVQNIERAYYDLSDDDSISGIIGLYTRGQHGLECLIQKSSIDSHTDGHDVDYSESQFLGLLGVYAYGQCRFDTFYTPISTPHKVENAVAAAAAAAAAADDDDDSCDYEMFGAFGVFTRD